MFAREMWKLQGKGKDISGPDDGFASDRNPTGNPGSMAECEGITLRLEVRIPAQTQFVSIEKIDL